MRYSKPFLFSKIFTALVWFLAAGVASAAEKLELKGQFQQGGIIFGRVVPGYEVHVGGRQARITGAGNFVFGLAADAPPTVILTLTEANGRVESHTYEVAQRVYKEQRIEGVEQKHVTPPPELTARIRREAELARNARMRDDERADFTQDFIWPLSGPITGVYGSRRVYNGTPRSPHYGLDIAAPTGTKVVAPAAGLITLAEDDMFYSGGTLILDHGHGLSSTFIHLSELLVDVGESVQQGQVIAEVGATGRVTGPHLDWRMNWFDVRLDPALLMVDKPMPKASLKTPKE